MTATQTLALSMGDPAGVGPEVLAKFLYQKYLHERAKSHASANLLLLGSLDALQRAAAIVQLPLPSIRSLSAAECEALIVGEPITALEGELGCWDLGTLPQEFAYGQVQAACGQLAVTAVERAAQLCLAGSTAGMVTCPINKEAIHAAGFVDDIGHQEILARLTGSTRTATMLMTPGLKVVHLSTHKSLGEAVAYVRQPVVLDKLQLTDQTLRTWGLSSPRIAVAGLNPHNGEGGLLGREEIEEIAPAVAGARELGIDATGPIPADSVFNRALAGEFDAVLAMYHDQGHIAIKVHDFHRSTTATLGIPLVRTSVDHGTAFDIAGTGAADATGLASAVLAAEKIVAGELHHL